MPSELSAPIDAATVERVLLQGDLGQLTPAQKIAYYRSVCDSLGLNPLTQPFDYIVLEGKERFYAKREATEQLRKIHNVSLTITARETHGGVYVVSARATLPNGRTDESTGVVAIAGRQGDILANLYMKAESKAKRRVTLSICGLGMLDESELDTLPPSATAYSTTQAPPPPRELDDVAFDGPPDVVHESDYGGTPQRAPLPDGVVRITRVDTAKTKNPDVVQYRVQLSTGERPSTISEKVGKLAQWAADSGTPVRVVLTKTGQYLNLVEIKTANDGPLPF